MRGISSPKNVSKAPTLKKSDSDDDMDGGGTSAPGGGGDFKEIPLQDLTKKTAATRAPASDTVCEIERVQVGDGARNGGGEEDEGGMVGGGAVTRDDMTRMCWQKILEQTKGVLPVCFFLAGFQLVILHQPIPGGLVIAAALGLAIIGLALFNFGLLTGLMPIGEKLGQGLPHAMSLKAFLLVAGLLGVAVTLAEPALSVVKTAGSLIRENQAPYLFSLLHDRQDFLVLAVAGGVGASASLGMLRTRNAWSMKTLVLTLVPITLALSYAVVNHSSRGDVVGLAWDLGAVTTGPVTVPLVIALGVGVAGAGHNSSPLTGFGVVTLASLIPVDAVLVLSLFLPHRHGRPAMISSNPEGGPIDPTAWYDETPFMEVIAGIRALVPLVGLMFCLKIYVLKDRSRILVPLEFPGGRAIYVPVELGLAAAQLGIIVFNIGLTKGLSQLGTIVGGATPSAFAEMPAVFGSPLYGSGGSGVFVAAAFTWLLGFGATLAEPALATLAVTVEKLTDKGMTQRQVVYGVAVGVGTGTSLGLLKIVNGWALMDLLIPAYVFALALTIPSQELYVCVAWDSAGVTTGPVTVPLVISLGLGLGSALGVADGFGILSLASVCPVISVLLVGLCGGGNKGGRGGGGKGSGYSHVGKIDQLHQHSSDGEAESDTEPGPQA